MSNIEKIKAEIERRIENYWSDGDVDSVVVSGELEELIDFIDSLPDESCKDSLHIPKTCKENPDSFTSLEEAASRGGFDYVDEIEAKAPGLPWNDHDVEFGYRDGFIAGAKWQKEQMTKEAVEGKVFMSFAPGHNQMVMADVDLPTNTKVKLIIVKQ